VTTSEDAQALQIARAFGDPVRFAIYKRITEMTEMRCGDICLGTPVRASTVSHHLKVLSEAGLVESRRDGQCVYYRWIPRRLEAYLRYLRQLKRAGSATMRGMSIPSQP
jgi:ArsR family transcriptional regulator